MEEILNIENKLRNKRQLDILGVIWDKGQVSRSDLARELNTSKVSISQNIDKLLEKQIIYESDPSLIERGRRPVPISLKKDLFYTVGICFYHEYYSKIVILNSHSEVVDEFPLRYTKKSTWMVKCDYVIELIKKLVNKNNIPLKKLIGFGIALPGRTNPESGEVLSSSEFEMENRFNICRYFEEAFSKKTCSLINISHLSAFVEHKWGFAKKMSSFIFIHSGFGMGMFLNGRLYRGHQYYAGEIGMLQLQTTGEVSRDGRVGTLGTLAPFYKITDKLEELICKGVNTEVKKYLSAGEKRVTLEMIIKAIEDGDQLCAQMMSEHFEIIGRAIVNMAYIFNPEAIFLPSWTSRCQDTSISIVRRMIGHYVASNLELKIDIFSANCTGNDLAKGASLLAVNKLFNKDFF